MPPGRAPRLASRCVKTGGLKAAHAFWTTPKLGIDLHSNNHVVVVIDQEDPRVYEKRLRNELNLTLEALVPFRKTLQGVAVESTFNGYWLVDG